MQGDCEVLPITRWFLRKYLQIVSNAGLGKTFWNLHSRAMLVLEKHFEIYTVEQLFEVDICNALESLT